jgi:hypothetical protein
VAAKNALRCVRYGLELFSRPMTAPTGDGNCFSSVGAVCGREECAAVCQVWSGALFAADDRSYKGRSSSQPRPMNTSLYSWFLGRPARNSRLENSSTLMGEPHTSAIVWREDSRNGGGSPAGNCSTVRLG